jgi:hypothetical protein
MSRYLQVGCGLTAPKDWINYDASPMVWLQKIPILGAILQKRRNISFPKNVLYGNILRGFPQYNQSCDAVYCSHMLEHLTYEEFFIAIDNIYSLLKKDGVFRLVMPDLKLMCESYMGGGTQKSILFMKQSGLGMESIRTFTDSLLIGFRSRHYWLWDYASTEMVLQKAGFRDIRRCAYHDSKLCAFNSVEDINRFEDALAIEAIR